VNKEMLRVPDRTCNECRKEMGFEFRAPYATTSLMWCESCGYEKPTSPSHDFKPSKALIAKAKGEE